MFDFSALFGKKARNAPQRSAAAGEVPDPAPLILNLPPADPSVDMVERYWLDPPFSYANIFLRDSITLGYEIVEPKVTEKELIILEETFEQLRAMLIYDTARKRGELGLDLDLLRRVIRSFDPEIPDERVEVLVYYLQRNFLGYGKLDPLMNDDKIEDITCNGPDVPIFLYHRKYANIQTNCVFDGEELNKFVLKLAQKADKQLSLSTPLIDAALPEGSRAQITYSDIISSKGSSFTIRKFRADPMTPVNLIANHTYDLDLMAHIWLAVENRKSMIISGGTASGKTSTMNAVSFFIPPVAKIVSIEDTREIQLPHINWLPMRTRESTNVSGTGNVGMFHLLKAALRQRPEYIIVGEVRGEEAQTLFQAMNTGHTTYSTVHAGNVRETVNRLIHDPINVPVAMFNALDLVLVQSLLYDKGRGFRRCLSLNEIRVVDDEVRWEPLFTWDHRSDSFVRVYEQSAVFDDIAYRNGWSREQLEAAVALRRTALEGMIRAGPLSPSEVGQMIQEMMAQGQQ
ncbi:MULTISPECIES: type II/IV secretion system ATPase subunit [Methanoculleus]|jgi:flagellar protein FlaI|uniref:type II/IV secretion system ATPase subunit n=1 Tax=Methanoculleus TaxID=45989 RepID=UPI0022ED5E0D|nr:MULTISPECIES: type II/IV secretion system ATPase subunit [Methanoculleus]GLI45777.1 type II secretion system protein [Methanoculleus bourgensis]